MAYIVPAFADVYKSKDKQIVFLKGLLGKEVGFL
jgi:hypothetical protein